MLRNTLQELAANHPEGDIWLTDLSGNRYTPQQLLNSLDSKSLSMDAGGETSGSSDWITTLKTSFFGRVKATRFLKITASQEREGWGGTGIFFHDETYKLHYLRFDPEKGRFASLCKRDFHDNVASTWFLKNPNQEEGRLCKICFKKLQK